MCWDEERLCLYWDLRDNQTWELPVINLRNHLPYIQQLWNIAIFMRLNPLMHPKYTFLRAARLRCNRYFLSVFVAWVPSKGKLREPGPGQGGDILWYPGDLERVMSGHSSILSLTGFRAGLCKSERSTDTFNVMDMNIITIIF